MKIEEAIRYLEIERDLIKATPEERGEFYQTGGNRRKYNHG